MLKIKIGNLELLKILLVVAIASIIILLSVTQVSARKRYGSGNQNPKPTPTVTPRPPRCGNNQCDPGETCDGAVYCVVGGNLNQRSCRSSSSSAKCTFCGDGIVQRSAGEDCDDGNSNNGDSCTNACRANEVKGTQTTTPTPTPKVLPSRPTLVRTGISLVVPFALGLFSIGTIYLINRKRN